ncbi:hypothetical protein AABB24_037045 [Solanum stoloniferum]|uniref:3-hydroxyisobutyryl-CoA hydrolase n=1 Tax=Solanum stoloniferum TaxID=62892 RepID=A0ABD2R2Y3_9SOLN
MGSQWVVELQFLSPGHSVLRLKGLEVLFLVGFNTNFPGLTFGLLHSNQSSQVFANPETLIGFHPDAGASFYLSNLPGYLGEYLALTGDKLSGAEMMSCGLATHYSLSERLPLIEEQLGKLMMDDPSVIGNCLAKFEDVGHLDQMSVFQRIEILHKCFSNETVEEIIDSLVRM